LDVAPYGIVCSILFAGCIVHLSLNLLDEFLHSLDVWSLVGRHCIPSTVVLNFWHLRDALKRFVVFECLEGLARCKLIVAKVLLFFDSLAITCYPGMKRLMG